MKPPATLAVLLEGFFTQRLMKEKQASPHTLRSYRDTFRLLLRFAQQCSAQVALLFSVEEIDAPLVTSFLKIGDERGIRPQSKSTFDSNPLVFPLCRL
jgi:site-specific recombinase XerC